MIRGPTGLLLAAGQSRRFGSNKLLHCLDDGTPMVLASLRHLHAALRECIVIVDNLQGEVAALLRDEGVAIVENRRSALGMGTSIACGVAASRTSQGWVIALADMPYIPAALIHQVASGLVQGADVIAPSYRGQRGHPVGFSSRHAGCLMRLEADEGARGVIRENTASVINIEVQDPAVVIDIDTLFESKTVNDAI